MKTIKLVSPLKVFLYAPDSDSDNEDFLDGYPTISAEEVVPFKLQILGQIKREELPQENLRGLMNYYHEDDEVNKKVLAARPTVEVINGQLAGVCYCTISEDLTTAEQVILVEYITGQYSDGWGEGFEQREISIGDGQFILVSFWSSDVGWSICIEQCKEEE